MRNGILCMFFGHRFGEYGASTPCWARLITGGKPASGWYKTITAQTSCERCGFTKSDSFVVPAKWHDKPKDSK